MYMHPYFEDEDFPMNMPDIWESHFLRSRDQTGQALIIGTLDTNWNRL